ncbi:hypothetical protein RZS28_16305 [Methylocapsa polymorpha]|uniref:Gfo/Idh/MocA family oxidoreductase n=1 Tax=Methylocapsa polymorpha TaxID=3080828 RepID=A0ABZ0HS07_9HYPH|nr:hypothetical protein RZS28_16305 [Methylocapsa sp. RX1]
MTIGIIGAGEIRGAFTRPLGTLEHGVFAANSPEAQFGREARSGLNRKLVDLQIVGKKASVHG